MFFWNVLDIVTKLCSRLIEFMIHGPGTLPKVVVEIICVNLLVRLQRHLLRILCQDFVCAVSVGMCVYRRHMQMGSFPTGDTSWVS